LVLALAVFVLAPPARNEVQGHAQQSEPLWDTGTFSILGYDPATGEVGGAVQSRVFSVGNGVLWADADVGVAATQAIVDVGYGPKALELLRQKMSPKDIIQKILKDDPDPLPERWSKEGRRRRHARPAVGGARDREEKLWRVAAQRYGAAAAGRRQRHADRRAEAARREMEHAPAARGHAGVSTLNNDQPATRNYQQPCC